MAETIYHGATAEYVITDAEIAKLNAMCPAAADAQLGDLIKVIIVALNDLNARLDTGGHT